MDRTTCEHFTPSSLPCTQCEIEARDAEIERLTARVHDLENELAAGVHTCGPKCRKTPGCAERADLREAIRICLVYWLGGDSPDDRPHTVAWLNAVIDGATP